MARLDLALSFYYLRKGVSVIVFGRQIVPSLFFPRGSKQLLRSQRIGLRGPILEPIAVLLQHKGRLKQSLQSLLVENWFLLLIGHGLFCHASAPVTGSERDSIGPGGGAILVQFPHQNRPSTSVRTADAVGPSCRPLCLELPEESAISLIFNSLERMCNASRLYNAAPVGFRGKPFATANIICKKLHTCPHKCP